MSKFFEVYEDSQRLGHRLAGVYDTMEQAMCRLRQIQDTEELLQEQQSKVYIQDQYGRVRARVTAGPDMNAVRRHRRS